MTLHFGKGRSFGHQNRKTQGNSSVSQLALSNGAQIGMIGDSIVVLGVADNASAGLTTLGTTDKSELLWAQFFLPKFRTDIYPSDETTNTTAGVLAHKYWSGRIMGTGGDKSNQTKDRFSLALGFTGNLPSNTGGDVAAATNARSMTFFLPDAVIYATGTNNLATGDTIIADLTSAFNTWKAAGKAANTFMPATIRPFGASTDSATDKAVQFPIRNQQIRDFCTANGLVCIDLAYAYCGDYNWHPADGSDPAVPGGAWSGNLHPNATACQVGGIYIASVLQPLFTGGGTTPFFDGTSGLASANANDETGGGTPTSSGLTGLLSGSRNARWSVTTTSSASTCVVSTEDNGDGTRNMVLTITPLGAASLDPFTIAWSIAQSVTTPTDYRNTWVRFVAPVQINASDYWGPVRALISAGGGNRSSFAGTSTDNIKCTLRNGWLISQPFLVPAGATTINFQVIVNVRAAAAVAGSSPAMVFRLLGKTATHGVRIIPESNPIPTGG